MSGETKWTKGEWTLEREDMPGGEFIHQIMANGYVIANVAESDYPDGEIARALFDARLMRAAPTLYSALEELASASDGYTGGYREAWARLAAARASARVALRAARGETKETP